MDLRIAIALGDVTGIGPEVTLKALAARPATQTRFVLVGDAAHVRGLNSSLRLGLDLQDYAGPDTQALISVLNRPLEDASSSPLQRGSAVAANAAVAWLKDGAERCLAGEFHALVTAPVNKDSIVRAGHKSFIGQTEYLSQLAGADRTAMMLLGQDDRGRWLRVALVTTHLSIAKLPAAITIPKVELAIDLAAQACRELRLERARVGVCGLNPHAGENGQMGNEEITTIGPAVDMARRRGIDAIGPISADALFFYAYKGNYDAVVAMYHDQGLAPLKMVAFEQGINWTLGLPFIRTSPDHGTAYDIAGQNKANPSSMQAAIRLAVDLARSKAPAD